MSDLLTDATPWRIRKVLYGYDERPPGNKEYVSKRTVEEKANIMGDKSPKAVNKQATQKQARANSAAQKKQQAITAKQVAGKKT